MEVVRTLGIGIAGFTAIFSASFGLAELVAPKATLSMFRAPTAPMNIFRCTVRGAATTAYGVAMMATILAQAPFPVAVASSLIPWAVHSVGCVWKDVTTTLGIPKSGYFMPLLLGPVIGYLCMTAEPSVAHAVANAFAGFIALNGTTLLLTPGLHVKAYGGPEKPNEDSLVAVSLRILGCRMLSYASFMLMVGAGVNPIRAVGASWIPIAVSTGVVLFSDVTKKLKVPVAAITGWIVPHLVIIAGTYLLSN